MEYLMNLRSVMMKSKKEVKPNNKKIVFETILVPLCIFYLYYMAFHNHTKASYIISSIVTIMTCIEFLVLYIKADCFYFIVSADN